VQEQSLGNNEADFKTILNHLQNVYCGKIAYEFMHIPVSFTPTFGPAYQLKTYSLLVKEDGGIML
jgi:hypothetical protein